MHASHIRKYSWKKILRLTIQKISNIDGKLNIKKCQNVVNFCGIIYTLKVLIHREGFEN